MLRIFNYILGYRRFTVGKENVGRCAQLLLVAGISASFRNTGAFDVSIFKAKRVKGLLDGKIEYTLSECRGALGFIIENRKKYGAIIGIVLSLLLLLLSGDTVWEIKIEGVPESEAELIRSELSSVGFEVGNRWSDIDTERIEMGIIALSEEAGWININRRGGVAYVTVGKKVEHDTDYAPSGYSCIVASRDCVIEEINVKRGYAVVKKGETVKAGEVLISGVIPTELGGGFCYAEGSVTGRYSETLSVSVDRILYEEAYGEEGLFEINLHFFNKIINIFKNYRQSTDQCDIINKKWNLKLGKELPIGITRIYRRELTERETILCDEEMISRASELLFERLSEFLSDKTALRLRTYGDFVGDSYEICCDALVSSDVTRIRDFKLIGE